MRTKKTTLFVYPALLGFIIVLAFYFIWSNAYKPEERTDFIGEAQTSIIETAQDAEKALFYVDESAKYAQYLALEILWSKGGFKDVASCGEYNNFVIWKDHTKEEECFPDGLSTSFIEFFKQELDGFLVKYTETAIPLNNYDVYLEENKIIGIAKERLELDIKPRLKLGTEQPKSIGSYIITPNFKTEISYDLDKRYEEYKKQAESAAAKVIVCLAYGGLDENDDDMETCSRQDNAKDVVSGAEDLPGKFYIFFDIKDNSLKLQPLEIKFAYLLKDDIPPPKTAGLKLEKVDGKNVLKWNKNKASDTESYNIYYKKDSDFSNIDNAGGSIKGITELKKEIDSLGSGKYYIAVTAVDEAGKELKEVSAIVINV